jgi:hypothetical protein
MNAISPSFFAAFTFLSFRLPALQVLAVAERHIPDPVDRRDRHAQMVLVALTPVTDHEI